MVKFIRMLPVVLFVFSAAAGLWLSGVFFARFNIFPYPQINQLISDLKEQVKPHRYHRTVYDFHGVRYQNNLQRLLPKTLGPGVRGVAGFEGDIMHLNDVEELPSAIADSYPLFEAGDLVVSLRQLHLVLLIDPDTGVVKWHDADSTIMQHDPDFIGDGWIGTFDNNRDLLDRGAMLGGSRILGIRPHPGERTSFIPVRQTRPSTRSSAASGSCLPTATN